MAENAVGYLFGSGQSERVNRPGGHRGDLDGAIDGSHLRPDSELLLRVVGSTLSGQSLACGRSIWPISVCTTGTHFVAGFGEPVRLPESRLALPWSTDDGGSTWALSHETEIGAVLRAQGSSFPVGTQVQIAHGLLLDLAAAETLLLTGNEVGIDAVIGCIRAQLARTQPQGQLVVDACAESGSVSVEFVVSDDERGERSEYRGHSDHRANERRSPCELIVGRSAISMGSLPQVFPLVKHQAVVPSVGASPAVSKPLRLAGAPQQLQLVPDRSSTELTLNLLGPVELVGRREGDAPALTSQQLALVSFLACVGPVSGAKVVDALWSGEAISASRFPNLLAELRRQIGQDRLPRAVAGRYRVQGVGSDLERFEEVLGPDRRDEGRPIGDLLGAAELLRGPALEGQRGRYWGWVDEHPWLLSSIEALVVGGVTWAGSVCRRRGEPDGALDCYERGLRAVPLEESLMVCVVEVLIEMGRVTAAVRRVESWEAGVRRLGCGQPGTGPRRALAVLQKPVLQKPVLHKPVLRKPAV